MCYSIEARVRDLLAAAMQRGDVHSAERLKSRLDEIEIAKQQPLFFVSGFSHPKLLTFTNNEPMNPQLFSWGLIPGWSKDWKTADGLRKKTLNAKIETMFDLPSFKVSAKSKRCLIYVSSFYEYHSANKKKYPFRITMKDGSLMVFGGLWSEWTDKLTGEIINSVSIVTTEANELMAKIHNLPAASETPRMPVILTKSNQDEWLVDVKTDLDKQHILDLGKPLDPTLLKAHSVPQLIGKAGVGNTIEATQEHKYEDLLLEL